MPIQLNCLFIQVTFAAMATLAFTGTSAAQESSKEYRKIGKIERLDAGLDRLVASDAKIEVLAQGFTWCEGPVWNGDHLLFSDIPRNSIFKWSEADGIELFMKPSGYTGASYYGLEPGSNGLAFDRAGHLIACEHGDRRLSLLTKGGGKRTIVDNYQGKRLNSPNDLAIASDGAIYFTDPPYGLPQRAEDPRREMDFCGVYRRSLDGELKLLTKQFTRPNGIGLLPDEKTLIVAQSDPEKPIWKKLPINDDFTVGEGTVIYDASDAMNQYAGLPDGLAIHPSGVIFGSGPGGIYVLTADGKLLGRLITGQKTSNCTFNDDYSALYITADSYLCRVPIKK